MRLQFVNKFLSIDRFNSVELPDFVVLTGQNGSGKSHLLQAIERKDVAVEGVGATQISRFDYESFRLANEVAFDAQQLAKDRSEAWNFFSQRIKAKAAKWKKQIGENYEAIKAKCLSEATPLWTSGEPAVEAYKRGFDTFMAGDKHRNNPHAYGIYRLAKRLPHSIDELGEQDFLRLYQPSYLTNNLLPAQLGRAFWDYYVKYVQNRLWRYENETQGKNHDTLDERSYLEKYGPKPWDVVNKILGSFESLQYRVNSPEGLDIFTPFQLELEHISKPNLKVGFESLSSGERILMALVATVYTSASDGYFPDLLLLDEVDATLHPSMIRNMLGVVRDVFLANDVSVILVSHVPTTIALAPEESIYVMNPSGPARIEKRTRNEALEILTEGFATMEQGLRIFDEVAASEITLVSEGHNAVIIEKALQLYGVTGVHVLKGVQGITGASQLRTIFQFFCKVPHEQAVIIVWDWDSQNSLVSENNTHPFVMPRNPGNALAKRGIENAFPEPLFDGFISTTTKSNCETIRTFDGSRKSDFAGHVVANGTVDDFVHFKPLIDAIARIRECGELATSGSETTNQCNPTPPTTGASTPAPSSGA